MLLSLITVAPIGLVLGLLAFGSHGPRALRPTPGAMSAVAVLAFVIGPVALNVLGLFGWLLALAAVSGAIVVVAMLRAPAALRG